VDFLRSSRQWISWVVGCRQSSIRYSKPGSRTIGIGSGEAGATAPTTIFLFGAVLAQQHDEWTELRRYIGLDILAKSPLVKITNQTSTDRR
jgi:hypothetical protein